MKAQKMTGEHHQWWCSGTGTCGCNAVAENPVTGDVFFLIRYAYELSSKKLWLKVIILFSISYINSDPVHLVKKLRNCLLASRDTDNTTRCMSIDDHQMLWKHITTAQHHSQSMAVAVSCY
jgi:hypothetical protein